MYIYISGPYSSDPQTNAEQAIFMADWVASAGHTVFIPHLTHFWHLQIPHDYEFWMKQDLEWVKICDAVLRLPGESAGADREVALAQSLGKPIYYDLLEIPK